MAVAMPYNRIVEHMSAMVDRIAYECIIEVSC
jgi:hypothetical protein